MSTVASLSPAEVRALGGLMISCAGANEAALGMRALSWYNSVLRLGLNVPFVVVHDLGAALLGAAAAPGVPRDLAPGFASPVMSPQDASGLLGQYAAVLAEIAQTDIAKQVAASRMEDPILATLLVRALSPVADRWRAASPFEPVPLNADALTQASLALPQLWAAVDRRAELAFIAHLLHHKLHLLLGIEQVDLDTVELLGLLGADGSMPETELVDLLAAFDSRPRTTS